VITTRDLSPIAPVLARLRRLHGDAFGWNASFPALLLVDAYPDKSRAATAEAVASERVAALAAAAPRPGTVVEVVDPYGAFGRRVHGVAFGAQPCAQGTTHACPRWRGGPAAGAEGGCEAAGTRCVRSGSLRTTLPFLWAFVRLDDCGVGVVVHHDADVLVAPLRGAPPWAHAAAAVLARDAGLYAVHVADRNYPFGTPCASDDVACAECVDGRACKRPWCVPGGGEDRRRAWRGVPVGNSTLCASVLEARRPARIVRSLPRAARATLAASGHFSLEAFAASPARLVARLPLAVANNALELALEVTPAFGAGAVALRSDALGLAGKLEARFIHGSAYYQRGS